MSFIKRLFGMERPRQLEVPFRTPCSCGEPKRGNFCGQCGMGLTPEAMLAWKIKRNAEREGSHWVTLFPRPGTSIASIPLERDVEDVSTFSADGWQTMRVGTVRGSVAFDRHGKPVGIVA